MDQVADKGPTATPVDFAFAPATAEAAAVLGAARPGARTQRCFSECVAQPTPAAEVDDWVKFMQVRRYEALGLRHATTC